MTRIGESSVGADMLLQCGLMSKLAECNVFDMRPETTSIKNSEDSFIPTILHRYRYQILFPVLKLCLAILTSLGVENRQGPLHILKLVVAHSDVFHSILSDRRPARSLDLESLQELSLVTAVISRAATEGNDSPCFTLITWA